jgi:hypothetical protein
MEVTGCYSDEYKLLQASTNAICNTAPPSPSYFLMILLVFIKISVDMLKRTACDMAEETNTPWPESASKLYWLSNHRLLAKLVPIFADRGWHVVSVTGRD